MPDCDNWTAAMVLKWVLVRDLSPVVAMTESYGATAFSEDGKSRTIVPEDLSTVMTGYCTDTKLPLGQESIRETVLRSQRAIAAKEKIYRALRRGDLEGRARRNGTGDVETVKSNQWLSLKFQSWNGHDLAVPINVEGDILNLPRDFEDYLDGGVAADIVPAVWPDPLFAAEQVKKVWPAPEGRGHEESDPHLAPDRPCDPGARQVQSQEHTNRSTSGAQTKCERWLRHIGENELVKKSKPCWRSEAQLEFPALSGRGFDRAWGNVARDSPKISKAGRKPRQRN
jgi:hypothetical protein